MAGGGVVTEKTFETGWNNYNDSEVEIDVDEDGHIYMCGEMAGPGEAHALSFTAEAWDKIVAWVEEQRGER